MKFKEGDFKAGTKVLVTGLIGTQTVRDMTECRTYVMLEEYSGLYGRRRVTKIKGIVK